MEVKNEAQVIVKTIESLFNNHEIAAIAGAVKDGTAKARPNTTVREHIPLPGKGTSKPK